MDEKSTGKHPVFDVLPPVLAQVVINSLYPCDAWGCKGEGKIIKEQIGINYRRDNRHRCADLVWDRCEKHALMCAEFRSQGTKKYLCTRTCSIAESRDSPNTEQVDGYTQWYCSDKHFDMYKYGDCGDSDYE